MERPYRSASIVELEKLYAQDPRDLGVVRSIAHELGHRSTSRARRLAERIETDLRSGSTIEGSSTFGALTSDVESYVVDLTETETGHVLDEAPFDEDEQAAPPSNGQDIKVEVDATAPAVPKGGDFWDAPIEAKPTHSESHPDPDISNTPDAILDAWIALEVLSPQSFNVPEDLAGGDRRLVADLRHGLPWTGEGEPARPRTKLFYQVVLGAVRLDGATAILLRAFGDKRPERPKTKALAAMAVVTVDKFGRPAGENPIAVSSFGYGYLQTRKGKLEQLREWPRAERQLIQHLKGRLVVENAEGEIKPLTREQIESTAKWLASGFSIPVDQQVEPIFAIRTYHWYLAQNPPEPLLLNSFFLEDLISAQELLKSDSVGGALKRYLAIEKVENRQDLIQDRTALRRVLAPSMAPKARWPTNGGYSLSLMPQAAINIAFSELKHSGLVSVNGPPGTGKTTLLRDVVAGVVHARAEALCMFDDPESAFTPKGQSRNGNSFTHLYEISNTIRGFEMLVASSNNKAVENVSKELPGSEAVDLSRVPNYFRSIADAVAGGASSWGLIAAVLGNQANRSAFYRAFWKNKERGFSTFLLASQGKDVSRKVTDPNTAREQTVMPAVVTLEGPPKGRDEALVRWRKAKKVFLAEAKACARVLEEVSAIQDYLERMPALSEAISQLDARISAAQSEADAARRSRVDAERRENEIRDEYHLISQQSEAHREIRPNLVSRLFRNAAWRVWQNRYESLAEQKRHALSSATKAKGTADDARKNEVQLLGQIAELQAQRTEAERLMLSMEADVIAAESRLGPHFAGSAFWVAQHEGFQRARPWLTDAIQAQRDRCFATAFEVHKAFIEAAAKPIRNNLAAFFRVLQGSPLGPQRETLLPSLWSTLFLVTPAISTTFASVRRMLGRLPAESLGWLLIDEGGQALPQAAVGAILRAKRVMVVGDPMQIEPVVALSPSLTDRICLRFGVDPEVWSAPKASAQTLADSASRYGGHIDTEIGSTQVGIPLFVHRRCSEPMFTISNRVAYAGLMVNSTPQRESTIAKVLGKSRWIDVRSSSLEKWCSEEGQVVVSMLELLVQSGLSRPDVFCITPFRTVAARLRETLRHERALLQRLSDEPWKWTNERIGTVHTFQGKEAEAVFLVLGAQAPAQEGARRWASYPPNLVNVAVSRAKERLYVVGSRAQWANVGCFREIATWLES